MNADELIVLTILVLIYISLAAHVYMKLPKNDSVQLPTNIYRTSSDGYGSLGS